MPSGSPSNSRSEIEDGSWARRCAKRFDASGRIPALVGSDKLVLRHVDTIGEAEPMGGHDGDANLTHGSRTNVRNRFELAPVSHGQIA